MNMEQKFSSRLSLNPRITQLLIIMYTTEILWYPIHGEINRKFKDL